MSYIEAAQKVLALYQHPLTTREIVEEALRLGLIDPRGITPHVTMAARLYEEVRKHPEGPIVRAHEPGGTRARRGSVRWALREP
jgi:hypothetical protein